MRTVRLERGEEQWLLQADMIAMVRMSNSISFRSNKEWCIEILINGITRVVYYDSEEDCRHDYDTLLLAMEAK